MPTDTVVFMIHKGVPLWQMVQIHIIQETGGAHVHGGRGCDKPY